MRSNPQNFGTAYLQGICSPFLFIEEFSESFAHSIIIYICIYLYICICIHICV